MLSMVTVIFVFLLCSGYLKRIIIQLSSCLSLCFFYLCCFSSCCLLLVFSLFPSVSDFLTAITTQNRKSPSSHESSWIQVHSVQVRTVLYGPVLYSTLPCAVHVVKVLDYWLFCHSKNYNRVLCKVRSILVFGGGPFR